MSAVSVPATPAPPLPASSQPAMPVSQAQAAMLEALTGQLDDAGLWWISGYAAGLARARSAGDSTHPVRLPQTPLTTATTQLLSIVYGSQTGNAKRVAEQLAADAEAAGVSVRLLRADAYPQRELKTEQHLILVLSTQGDGDPSDDAIDLYAHLTGPRAPKLPQLHYAVLGLGDSSYPKFCAVGQALDARLAELGAQRLLARGDADLDIETVADPWRVEAIGKARDTLKPSATVTPLRAQAHAPEAARHGHDRPFIAEVLANQRITVSPSSKDVRHIELSLEGSGLTYEPGDALGVRVRNPDALVVQVLETLHLDGDTSVSHSGETLPLTQWLGEKRELTRLSRPFVAAHAALARSQALNLLLTPDHAQALTELFAGNQVIDLLQRHPGAWTAEQLVASLRPLAPRLYSIASSRSEVGDEVHLTVAHVQYPSGEQTRWGAASHFIANRDGGDTLPVYVEPNPRFRLPADTARDVIMIGPGTGVAPFRAFVQERKATRTMNTGTGGRNWLFFGNPHFRSDFLYQIEWQRALKEGALQRMDVAFSRDSAQKIYVQQRIRERGRDLYDWLQGGAYLYVCGAIAMGKDVHVALIDVVQAHAGLDADAAEEFLRGLRRDGRYATDLY